MHVHCDPIGRPAPGDVAARGKSFDVVFMLVAGNARPLEQALQHATTELVRWMLEETTLDERGASIILGQCIRYEIGNVFDPAFTVAKLEKRLLTPRNAALHGRSVVTVRLRLPSRTLGRKRTFIVKSVAERVRNRFIASVAGSRRPGHRWRGDDRRGGDFERLAPRR